MAKPTQNQRLGSYVATSVGGETVKAFVPSPLPPLPAIDLASYQDLLAQANVVLGRLDFVTRLIPDPGIFIYQFVRKEALLSSQIEGTQSSFSDLLLYENNANPVVSLDDVAEVSSYVAAMRHGLERLNEGFPISLRLFREIHGILISQGRGRDKQPGEFRRSQNWIGGTRPGNARFVPPPPDKLMTCLSDLEKFLHDDTSTYPLLVKAALAHVQFETIHPFLDGNGRLGRLLITLMLCDAKVLSEPTLYLSLYLKSHRDEYYRLLQVVREQGDWESWLTFFLEGILATAEQATDSAQQILKLFNQDRTTIQAEAKATLSVVRLHELLQHKPILSIELAAKALSLSFPTVTKAFKHLQSLNIVQELTGKQRDRQFRYGSYLKILSEGTDPL
jgi:Fic family protein